MTFKAVRVLVFSAMDLETALIRHYRENGSPSVWNGSGFGDNDPGRQRDLTALRADGFDANYPINIHLPIDTSDLASPRSVLDLLAQVSGRLPYTLRHEKTVAATELLRATIMTPSSPTTTMRELMTRVVAGLPSGWQATKLSGRVILYEERQDRYTGGESSRVPERQALREVRSGVGRISVSDPLLKSAASAYRQSFRTKPQRAVNGSG